MTEFQDDAVGAAFAGYPPPLRDRLLELRDLVFMTASKIDVGPLQERLKWGQPSYVPQQPRTGTPVRLAPHGDGMAAILVHCRTNLVARFRDMFPELEYDGNRAIVLDAKRPLPKPELQRFIELALTYHRR